MTFHKERRTIISKEGKRKGESCLKTRYGAVAVLLAAILVASLGITAIIGVRKPQKPTDEFSVVASFFPVYTAALQVVGDCEGVTVSCLTQPTAGCVHDYQLSPAERMRLSDADVLILNGAGAESFLTQTLATMSELPCVDTSQGIVLQEVVCEHDHEHDHEHTTNEHIWMSPSRYAKQVQRLCEGLCELDPAHAAEYTRNAEEYLAKINAMQKRLEQMALPFTHAVLFHDSVAYPANDLGLEVVGVVPLGEDEGASASKLAEIARKVENKAVLFLYDSQYPVAYESLQGYAKQAVTMTWDSAAKPINGVAEKDVWLVAMEKNVEALEKIAKRIEGYER